MSSALTNFQASLSRIRDIIADIDSNASLALKDPGVRARFETIRCSCMVILGGFFESFLRGAAEEFVKLLCAKSVPFNELPHKVRLTHFMEGAGVLEKASVKEKDLNPMIKSEDIVRRLASVNSSLPYELVWEAFADTRANPSPHIVREFLARFGIDEPGKKLSVKMGTSQGNSDTIHGSFLALRNECAHTGSALNVPSTSEISGFCSFLETLAKAIEDALQDHLAGAPFTATVRP